MRKSLIIGTTVVLITAVLLGGLFIIFAGRLRSEEMLRSEDWLRLAGLFSFFAIISVLGETIRRNWKMRPTDDERKPALEKGKGKYVFKFVLVFSLPIIVAISLPFIFPNFESTISFEEGLRNYVVLVIVAISCLTAIGISLWNRRERNLSIAKIHRE